MNPAGAQMLVRVEMWCARFWIESRNATIEALACGDAAAFHKCRADAREWMEALLVVNRLSLGIEPQRGETFLDEIRQSGRLR
jgi:hypothetical protein